MKFKMIQVIGLLLTAFSSSTLSAPLPIGAQNFSPENILVNPGFENGSYGWTASGGAIKAANSTAKGSGSFGYDWDSNAAAQTLVSNLITIPPGYQGRNGLAYCSIKVPSGTATHTITVDDGVNNLASPVTITSSNSSFIRTPVNFIFPSSGSVRLKISSVASNEPEIYVDQCYIGDAANIYNTSQAQLVGSIIMTGTSCQWSTTSTSLADFAAATTCAYTTSGSAQSPATQIPAIKFATLPPGEYVLQYEGSIGISGGGLSVHFQFWDGTNTAREISTVYEANTSTQVMVPSITQSISYTTAQSNVTLSIRGKVSAAGTTAMIGQNASSLTPYSVIKVYRFPTTSETAYRPDQLPASWSGYFNTNCTWTTSSASYADAVNANSSCNLVERQNRNFGSVSPAGGTGASAKMGITFTPQRTGRYLVIVHTPAAESSSGHTIGYDLTDGTTILDEHAYLPPSGGGYYSDIVASGIYNAASTSPVTIKMQTKITGAVTATFGNGGLSSAGSTMEWQIIPLDLAFPTPVLVGAVTSNTSGQLRIEHANFGGSGSLTAPSACSSTPCTIYQQSGSWLSSVTRLSAGTYVLNLAAGSFSARPSCSLSGDDAFTGYNCVRLSTNGVSSTTIGIQCLSAAGAAGDASVDVTCTGPR